MVIGKRYPDQRVRTLQYLTADLSGTMSLPHITVCSREPEDMLDQVQQRWLKALQHLPYEQRLRKLGLFSLGKRGPGDLITVYKT